MKISEMRWGGVLELGFFPLTALFKIAIIKQQTGKNSLVFDCSNELQLAQQAGIASSCETKSIRGILVVTHKQIVVILFLIFAVAFPLRSQSIQVRNISRLAVRLIAKSVEGDSYARFKDSSLLDEYRRSLNDHFSPKSHIGHAIGVRESYRDEKQSTSPNYTVIDTVLTWNQFYRDQAVKARRVFTFDTQGRMLTSVGQGMSEGAWYSSDSISYTYDLSERMISNSSYYVLFGIANRDMQNNWRSSYTYDQIGRKVGLLLEMGSGSDWENFWRYRYEYDASGRVICTTSEQWKDYTWKNNDRVLAVYNNAGECVSSRYDIWLSNIWVPRILDMFQYDEQSRLVLQTDVNWYASQAGAIFRDTCIYDEHGNLSYEFAQHRDSTGLWVNGGLVRYTRDENGNALSKTNSTWSRGEWENSEREDYSYDGFGNMTSRVFQWWQNGRWVNNDRSAFTYDSIRQLQRAEYFWWDDSVWMPALGNLDLRDDFENHYSVGGSIVTIHRTSIHFGNPIPHTALPVSAILRQNYPNPFNPVTTIKYLLLEPCAVELNIYNTLGQQIEARMSSVQGSGERSIEFNASNLSSGTYYYRLTASSLADPSRNFIQTRKMTIVK